ncbi:hypothetical protein [Clostridium sp.]|uniref:hypothetical protein n=1 Tax=Clostridium sp. TaxID=1506 RepID=UPI0026DAF581|nr:hypothetical protein [Clostridium sp.]MDO5039799.1 hypothetical protein [Clostridium sp.]
MKKILIGLLILGNVFVVSGCNKGSNQLNQNNSTTQVEEESPKSDNQTVVDESKPDDKTTNKEESNKHESINKDSINDKSETDLNNSNDTSTTTNEKNTENNESKNNKLNNNTSNKETNDKLTSKKESVKQDHKNTPSDNKVVENRVKEKTKNNESTQDTMSPYYGTWSIDKVIGHTLYSTNNTSPLNKTLVISKNKYVNNAFNVKIDKPKYLITKLSEKDFCRGYKMDSLKGTGLNEGPITALDITSSTDPNSDFDELYIQNGYLIYLQDGVFFKCSKR